MVTCTHAPTLNSGASFPVLTLTVNVLETAAATVDHTVTVSTPSYEFDTANNTATDTTAVVFPNLSTSTKSVVDLNGGEAQPGDTLRYTITLIESAGFPTAGVSITDHIPANTTFASIVSIPAGATSSFRRRPAGNNNKGLITVTGITVPASSTRTVVFDVTVDNAEPGRTDQQPGHGHQSQRPGRDTIRGAASRCCRRSCPVRARKQLYLWSSVAAAPDAHAAQRHARHDRHQWQQSGRRRSR